MIIDIRRGVLEEVMIRGTGNGTGDFLNGKIYHTPSKIYINVVSTDISFEMPCPCRTLDTSGTLLPACPSHVLLKKMQDMAGTREQEELNTLSQNK